MEYKRNMQVATSTRRGPIRDLDDAQSESKTGNRMLLNDSQPLASEDENAGLIMVRAERLAAQHYEAIEPKLQAMILQLCMIVALIIKCFGFFSPSRIPREIGYVWNNEMGRVTSITILDALGGSFTLPQELCEDFTVRVPWKDLTPAHDTNISCCSNYMSHF